MIHVTGDFILDEYWYGKTTRISPEAPVPIVELSDKKQIWGGSGNVWKNINAIDPTSIFHGYSEKSLNLKEKNAWFLEIDKIPVKTRVMSDGHYITRIDDEEYITDTKLEESFLSNSFNLNSNDIFVISDYNKGTIKNPKKIIDKLKAKVLIDPKLSLDHYKGAYLIKPNKKEFESFVGKCETPKKLIAQAQLLRDHLDLTYLVVTLGSEGVLLIGDSVEHYPAEVEEVFDVTGAGDTFMAGLALSLSLGYDISKSTIIANRLAGISVSHKGTYAITKEDWNGEKIINNGK